MNIAHAYVIRECVFISYKLISKKLSKRMKRISAYASSLRELFLHVFEDQINLKYYYNRCRRSQYFTTLHSLMFLTFNCTFIHLCVHLGYGC